MDRFVIRKPKFQKPAVKKQVKPKGQATLFSLKRVVVVEDIKRWKCILELPNQSRANLLDTLHELKKKIPSEDIIRSTKIGEAVEKLQTHSDEEVSGLAHEVHDQWETFIKANRGKANIEVRCDAATEKLRMNARRLLSEALSMEADDSLVECIEREVFHQASRLINVHYRRTIRALVFALKHKAETRSHVKDGTITINELARSHKK
uniref:Transcription elongation factor A N-terminal and central domain containing 2 n=1 Tax=Leptobrachium leishanense TaxID=445787 RepID=A0A8C5R7Y0_9ANUR